MDITSKDVEKSAAFVAAHQALLVSMSTAKPAPEAVLDRLALDILRARTLDPDGIAARMLGAKYRELAQ